MPSRRTGENVTDTPKTGFRGCCFLLWGFRWRRHAMEDQRADIRQGGVEQSILAAFIPRRG